MKKKLFLGLMAAAAVSFTACQKDEVLNEVPQDQPIEFGTYIGRDAQTKASVINLDALKEKGFGVFAYYTGQNSYDEANSTPNFMYNEQITWSTNAWTYNPVKYWPNNPNDKVSFFAYAPYAATNNDSKIKFNLVDADTKGDFEVKYVIPETVTEQIDLLYANNNNINKTKQSITGNINFQFKHALSRVGFKVESVIDEVNNQNNGATPDTDNQNKDYIATNATIVKVEEVELIANNKFFASGDLNLNGGTWTKTYADRTHASYKLGSSNFEATVADNVTKSAQLLNKADSYMMLIPANLTDATEGIKIRVKYTVTTTDAKLPNGKSEIVNDITSESFAFNFDQGKAYNFVLHLGMTSVKLTADVEGWDPADGTDVVVNVPINFN